MKSNLLKNKSKANILFGFSGPVTRRLHRVLWTDGVQKGTQEFLGYEKFVAYIEDGY